MIESVKWKTEHDEYLHRKKLWEESLIFNEIIFTISQYLQLSHIMRCRRVPSGVKFYQEAGYKNEALYILIRS